MREGRSAEQEGAAVALKRLAKKVNEFAVGQASFRKDSLNCFCFEA